MAGNLRNTSETAEMALAGLTADEARKILASVAGLRFGSVEVVVHDGRVVQIERTEKIRIDAPPRKS